METNTKSKKPLVILAIVLVVAIAVFAAVYFATRTPAQAGAKTIIVQVFTDEGADVQTFTIHTDEEFLGPVLLNEGIAEGENSDYGLFIATAGGRTADEAKQEWWRISKGGEDVMTGADATPIAHGDTFELTLMTGW